MVDRGKGFYAIAASKITSHFQDALRENGLTNMMGEDASIQPGHMQEVMLHETAVTWIRWRLTQTTPARCWLESRPEYEARLKRVVSEINQNLDVEGLCYGLPKRPASVIVADGGCLKE